jgi:predicted AAA+ superfamily ATPase
VLEASYIIRLLRPYFNNFLKRTTKTPKLYFVDTGLACYLQKIRNAEQLKDPVLKGRIFESWVISELMKQRLNRSEEDNLYFWHELEGLEIDVVVDNGATIMPMEIKAGRTPKVEFAGPLLKFMDWASSKAKDPTVIYGGEERWAVKGVNYHPWHDYFLDINAKREAVDSERDRNP